VTLATAAVSVRGVVQEGLLASVPAWLAILAATSAFFAGGFAGRAWRRRIPPRPSSASVTFDYLPDSPISHGWELREHETPPTFSTVRDGFVGKALKIEAAGRYALDYVLPSWAKPSRLGIVARWTPSSLVYLHVRLVSSDSRDSIIAWLQLRPGTEEPQLVGQPDGHEMTFPVTLEGQPGDWQRCDIDLPGAIRATFGEAGWRYEQLLGYRLRGTLELARVEARNAG
jgi:hypothetical protein